MLRRNPHLAKLKAGYLFPEIAKRKRAFLQKNPSAKLISLGVGDTTEPLTPEINRALVDFAEALGTPHGYTGYGPDQGYDDLREAIATQIYQGRVDPNDIFVSDGAKPDLGRLQLLFDSSCTVAIQDPAYPVYVDTSLISGKRELKFLPCTAENDFFPDLEQAPEVDIVYFCSPNNPTGAVATLEQLKKLVTWVKKIGAILIYDAAYSAYIRDPALPRSIYEVEGAKSCAIELGSFSKMAGFSGVRLGWSVVPQELSFEDGHPVKQDWHRIMTTFFNGASTLSQKGSLKALSEVGMKEMAAQADFYLENTDILRKALQAKGLQVYGGSNAPYLWVKIPGKDSWTAFEEMLEQAHLVTTPGSGFGPAGEGFLRFSAFGHREDILTAAERLKTLYKV